MLIVNFGYNGDKLLRRIPSYFNEVYEKEWFSDPLVKDMVKDIDQSNVVADGVIDSPFLGLIPPTELSGGLKGLLLMKFEESVKDRYFYGGQFGDNTLGYMLRIADESPYDIKLAVNHSLHFPDKFNKIYIENDKTTVDNIDDFFFKYLKYKDTSIPER